MRTCCKDILCDKCTQKELARKKLAKELHDEVVGASFKDIYYEIYGVRLRSNIKIQ